MILHDIELQTHHPLPEGVDELQLQAVISIFFPGSKVTGEVRQTPSLDRERYYYRVHLGVVSLMTVFATLEDMYVHLPVEFGVYYSEPQE